MYDNYDDACFAEFSRERARFQIEDWGGGNWAEFVEDNGDKPTYTGKELLDWLGY